MKYLLIAILLLSGTAHAEPFCRVPSNELFLGYYLGLLKADLKSFVKLGKKHLVSLYDGKHTFKDIIYCLNNELVCTKRYYADKSPRLVCKFE